jgi:hypothetical protein
MDSADLRKTKALMGALLRMPPKPHSEMKLDKKKRNKEATARKANRRPPVSSKST